MEMTALVIFCQLVRTLRHCCSVQTYCSPSRNHIVMKLHQTMISLHFLTQPQCLKMTLMQTVSCSLNTLTT